jgi:hypothetical protein
MSNATELESAYRRIGMAVGKLRNVNPIKRPAIARAELSEAIAILNHALDDISRHFDEPGRPKRKAAR